MLPYLTHKAYMKERYGEALFSIPVNLEFGCPNRNSEGQGGCTFCPEHGARAAQIADAKSVEEQIQKALSFAKRRYNAQAFALYIQAYTGTFASLLTQKETYAKLLSFYPFKALHIGTRPDCLSEATLVYLSELNQHIDVVIELGVQSLHDASLERINRGHDAACSLNAIERLHAKGLKVYAHLIIGLPDETPAMWKQSLQGIIDAHIDGIKFHNLHVISGTDLAREYAIKPFHLLSEYAYAEALIELLRYVPSSIPIIRLSTDTPEHELIAPKWHMAKGQFGEYVLHSMQYRGIYQGDKVDNKKMHDAPTPQAIILEDGSVTLWNALYRDYYHPKAGAYRQAKELFIEKSGLKKRLETDDVTLLEIGFGMGYNTYQSVKLAKECAKHHLHVKAIDQDFMLVHASQKLLQDVLHVKMLQSLIETKTYQNEFAWITLIIAEARYALRQLHETFDVIFLDPFLESNNASLVTLEFFQTLRTLLKSKGVLVASTSLLAVQSALSLAGFEITLANDNTSDIKGLVATISSSAPKEIGRPYRDIYGVYNDKTIETLHQKSSN